MARRNYNQYDNAKKLKTKEASSTDGYAIFDAFLDGSISDKQYKGLLKRNARADQTEINEALGDVIRDGRRRPVTLNARDVFLSPMDGRNVVTDSIDQELLFEQTNRVVTRNNSSSSNNNTTVQTNIFGLPIRQQQPAKRSVATKTRDQFLMHNFDRPSAYEERLYKWSVFNDVTQKMMRPVYHLINSGSSISSNSNTTNTTSTVVVKQKTPVDANPMEQQMQHQQSSSGTYALQHKLAQSYHQEPVLSVQDFAESACNSMGARLLKFFVQKQRIIFVFDWHDSTSFMCFLAFDLLQPVKWSKSEYDGKEMVVLHGQDLVTDYAYPEDADEYNNEYTQQKKRDYDEEDLFESERWSGATRESKKLATSSFRVRVDGKGDCRGNEEEEEEEEAEEEGEEEGKDGDEENGRAAYNRQRNKAVVRENPMDFVVTFYGKRMNRHFLMKLKESHIAYHTYGYIKNDNTTF